MYNFFRLFNEILSFDIGNIYLLLLLSPETMTIAFVGETGGSKQMYVWQGFITKIQDVTHPNTSDTSRCWHSENVCN